MQHFYIKDKVRPQPSPPSPKAFLVAVLAILLITGYFTAKTLIKNSKQKSKPEQTNQSQPSEYSSYTPTLFPAESISDILGDNNYQLVDIRTKESWQKKHIENSINIPLSQLDQSLFMLGKDKKIIIISQKVDQQAKTAGAKIENQGFEVKILDGGFEKYYFENLPVISEGDPESISDKSKTNPLTSHELLEKINQGQRFTFIDTRPKEAFNSFHVEGAINIPLEEIENKKSDLPVGKILVCDESPLRSFQAAVKLYDMNVWTAFYLSDPLSTLKGAIEETAQQEETTAN